MKPVMSGDFVLTKALAKEFASLDDAKGRRRSGMFVAEGRKCVETLLQGGYKARYIFEDVESDMDLPGAIRVKRGFLREITRLSATPQTIAFFELPQKDESLPSAEDLGKELVLALDRVQDPGNMGTILRTADWMGIRTVIASRDTVDVYNPKAVQASMGAVANVRVVYTDLAGYLASMQSVSVYGTFLDGVNIYTAPLAQGGIIIMGNEGSGVSPEVAAHISHKLFIPPYGDGCVSESLNVSVATAIVLSQFRQRQFK